MPVSSAGASESLQHPRPARRGAAMAALRVALGVVLVAGAMAVPQLGLPATVEASSCTGWGSKTVPPPSIRVLRTRSGKVQKVSFRRYVAEVMASGEWPSRLRKATLEAGAVATKQYAWYYALKGNHRSGYRRNGKCYDVRDDSIDQLYRPERVEPTSKQQRAIDATWGLTLRKHDRFFLPGYRAGSSHVCAADANGWKLYAASVEACAAKGWSSRRILERYLNPNLKLVWSAKLGPLVTKPTFNLQAGTSFAKGAASVTWKPASSSYDIARYRLQRKAGKGSWRNVSLSKLTAKKAHAWIKTGVNNRFRVRARDQKGRAGPWSYSAKRKPALRGPVGLTLGGASIDPASKPVKVSTRFTGRSVAFVTRTGPGMGQAKVFVNGKKVATVDLERASKTSGALVWARNYPTAKRRSVAVKAIDPDVRVDFDGFFILR